MREETAKLNAQLDALREVAQTLQTDCDNQITLFNSTKERQTEKETQYETNIKRLESELESTKTDLLSWQNKEQLVRSDRDQQSLLMKNVFFCLFFLRCHFTSHNHFSA